MKITKTFRRFLFWLLINSVVSFSLTFLIWKLSGRIFSLNGKNINIEFYNTLCGTFGFVGLIIAIFQIAQLRTEQEITKSVSEETKINSFMRDSILKFNNLISEVQDLQKSINAGIYSHDSVTGYTGRLNDFVNILNTMEANELSLNCTPILNCNNCVTLMAELQGDFYKIIEKNAYNKIKKQQLNEKIVVIIRKLSECESNLKSKQ